MPPRNLLALVQVACDELGLQRPAVVANATDLQARQLFALLNRDLKEVQQEYDWTALQTEFTLSVAPPVLATGSTTQSRQVLLINDASLILPGVMLCMGPGIVNSSRVVSVDMTTTPNTVIINQPATVTASNVQFVFSQDTYAEPGDFDRFIGDTWWDRTNRWRLMGPDSPQTDQWHRSGVVTVGPRRHFRQIGALGFPQASDFNNDFNTDFSTAALGLRNYRLWPPPAILDSPFNIVYEYISKNCCVSATGTPQPLFQADTDYTILDEDMIILGVKWRFGEIKGFDYAPKQQEWRDYCERRYGNDGGSRTLSLSSRPYSDLISSANVQDGFFPGPGNP